MKVNKTIFKKISIIVPCYNESKTIEKILLKINKSDTLGLIKEVIVIDDCSTDSTRSILTKYKNISGHVIVFHDKNTGKGGALKTGFLKSSGDLVIVQDADLEYDPNEYKLLISEMVSGKYDVVYGSRYLGGKAHFALYSWHYLVNRFLTNFSNCFTRFRLTDMETCYKLFRGDLIRDLAPGLESMRFGFEPEITAKLSKRNVRLKEIPISYFGRNYKEGKHIKWTDGVKAVFEILKYNLLDD